MKPARFAVALLTLLLFGALDASAQQRTINGVVVGPDGQPAPFALVEVVGGPEQVNTDAEGSFTLQTRTGDVILRVTSFGFQTREVTVSAGENTVRVNLVRDALELEGIVVTGQATSVARRNLANAVSSVTPTELAEAPPSQSTEDLLQGRIAGALVERNSGAPGGGVQVRLRGASTLIGESEPLWVVDGVVMSNVSISANLGGLISRTDSGEDSPVNRIADLNPNDIERIEILKGASAAALYGSRAANGVILVTTKRGQPGQVRISASQRVGFFERSNSLPFREWDLEEAIDAGFFDDAADAAPFLVNGELPNFDLEDQIADRGDLSYETNVSVSGGDEDTRYFVSGTWRDDAGIIDRTGYEKASLRVNLEQGFSDRFQINVNTNLIRTVRDQTITNNENQGTSLYMVLPFTPSFTDLRRNADGAFPDNPFERSNPLQTIALVDNEEEVYRFVGAVTGVFDAYETQSSRLSFTSTLGVDYFNQETDVLFPVELEFEDDDDLLGTSLINSADNVELTWTGNGVFEWNSDTFRSTTTVGYQYGDRELNILSNSAEGLTAGQPNVDQGLVTNINETRRRIKDLGIFAQEELLLLDERLFLTGGVRADRSSVNADTDEFFIYPKASASYRFDEVTEWLDGVKLRAAWGQSGNLPLFGQKFTPLTTDVNIDGIPGAVIDGDVGAVDLQPEQQEEIEAGVDLTFLEGRGQLTATVFRKTITDLLLERTPALSSGFDAEFFNGGEMETEGIELALDIVPVQGPNFSWINRTTFYHDESEVTELPVPPFETDAGFGTGLGALRIAVGESPTAIVGNAGFDENGDQIVRELGEVNPDFRMGFTNNFEIFGFSVRSLFEWSEGQSVINLTQLLGDLAANWEDWEEPTEGGSTVGSERLSACLTGGFCGDVSPYVQDASYLKLREASISWQIPSDLLSGRVLSQFQSARLTVSGRNLVTFTPYDGLDPEVSNFANEPLARNFDVAPFPPSRSFWFGIDLSF